MPPHRRPFRKFLMCLCPSACSQAQCSRWCCRKQSANTSSRAMWMLLYGCAVDRRQHRHQHEDPAGRCVDGRRLRRCSACVTFWLPPSAHTLATRYGIRCSCICSSASSSDRSTRWRVSPQPRNAARTPQLARLQSSHRNPLRVPGTNQDERGREVRSPRLRASAPRHHERARRERAAHVQRAEIPLRRERRQPERARPQAGRSRLPGCNKSFEGRRPKSEYRITATGRKALHRYLEHIEAVIKATRRGCA